MTAMNNDRRVGARTVPRYNDPAEKAGYLKYFYRDWRPTRLGRMWSHLYAWVSSQGVLPKTLVTLETIDTQSGNLNASILVMATHEGKHFLVSMLGEGSQWVKNVRASGGFARIKRGKTIEVMLVEIAPSERAPMIRAWAQIATSGRKHLPIAFDAPLPDFHGIAAEFPVFRIEPLHRIPA